ncbi:reprolysin-like metallopeptidase [Candidatus Foliamicus sp.]
MSKSTTAVLAGTAGFVALLVAVTGSAPAYAEYEGDGIFLECPCRIEGDGETLSVTAGVRSYLNRDSGELRLRITAGEERWGLSGAYVATLEIGETLMSGDAIARLTREVTLEPYGEGPQHLHLELEEMTPDGAWVQRDKLVMELPVELNQAFDVQDLDYLRDTDEDGVGDANERLMGTDPEDPASTSERNVEIDVLALHGKPWSLLYGGSEGAHARIAHSFALTNAYLGDSGVNFRFRLVGTVEVDIEQGVGIDPELARSAAELHGSDLSVEFRRADGDWRCGFAYLLMLSRRGHLQDFEVQQLRAGGYRATVHNTCSGRTLAHELGHAMGLHHSHWQGSVGTWRWSRGHAEHADFNTIMSYSFGGSRDVLVFSNLETPCIGFGAAAKACGVARNREAGADAVTSLNAVSHQFARVRDSKPDTDGDGFVDAVDDFLDDPSEWRDTDGDGVGDRADEDDDGDGVPDAEDTFRLDATESSDADGDGIGDNADEDDDNDGFSDAEDAFPLDAAEWADSDGDGVGDNADAFPLDALEISDTDGDGIGDNADKDDDDDGVEDGDDAFPLDPNDWQDADGDGVGDNADIWPTNPDRSDLASYEFVGEGVGRHLSPGKWAGVGGPEAHVLLGIRYSQAPTTIAERNSGVAYAYVVARDDFVRLDLADGARDRVIHLNNIAHGENSWRLTGEPGDIAGATLTSSGDMDSDGVADFLVGARSLHSNTSTGAAYFVSGADLPAADAADGQRDGTVRLDLAVGLGGSYRLDGEDSQHSAGISVEVLADRDGDDRPEILLGGAAGSSTDHLPWADGAAYLVGSGDLDAADAADGDADGRILLDIAVKQPHSYRFEREPGVSRAVSALAAVGDADGDGVADILMGAGELISGSGYDNRGAAYLVSGARLEELDSVDGSVDGTIELALAAGNGAYRFSTPEGAGDIYLGIGEHLRSLSDMDNDGKADFMIGSALGAAWLISGASLTSMDAGDGLEDGHIDASEIGRSQPSVALNFNGEGLRFGAIADVVLELHAGGWDSCRAGAANLHAMTAFTQAQPNSQFMVSRQAIQSAGDAYAMLGAEPYDWLGQSGNAWADLDRDGASDILLGSPRIWRGDGLKEWRSPRAYLLMAADLAALDRADGAEDRVLHFGNFAGDTDGDGISNTLDMDDDGDGVMDVEDTFPLDAAEWSDHDGDCLGNNIDLDDDGDGVADHADPFPLDPLEWADTDGDGAGNNADTDDDGDGVGDAEDLFPLDSSESADSDGDGVGDNADAFPLDASETADTDGDGVGDNTDGDDDNDGVPDAVDILPLDPTRADLLSYEFVYAPTGQDELNAVTVVPGRWSGGSGPDALVLIATSPWLAACPEVETCGAAYLIAYRDLDRLDQADGRRDRVVLLSNVAHGESSWRLLRPSSLEDFAGGNSSGSLLSAGDMDGDGVVDVLVRGHHWSDEGQKTHAVSYFVSGADLPDADAADGVADRTVRVELAMLGSGSYMLTGGGGGLRKAVDTAMGVLSDRDGDGKAELLVGAYDKRPEVDARVAGYLLASGGLGMLDAADGDADGRIELRNAVFGGQSYRFLREREGDGAGSVLEVVGDADGDGVEDFLVSAGFHDHRPATEGYAIAYFLSGGRLAELDAADGSVDNSIDLGQVAGNGGYRFAWGSGEARSWGGSHYFDAVGDMDADDLADFMIGSGARPMLVVSGGELPALDLADGAADGRVDASRVAAFPRSFGLDTWLKEISPATNGTFLLETGNSSVPSRSDAPCLSGYAALYPKEALKRADRAANDLLNKDVLIGDGDTYWLLGAAPFDLFAHSRGYAGSDYDADGLPDTLLTTSRTDGSSTRPVQRQSLYLLMSADLAALDAADGASDRRLHFGNFAGDTDGDGLSNTLDADDDGDGVEDGLDAYKLDGSEWSDFDGDCRGDNADLDDDNDGVPDADDAFPLDPTEWVDTDGDGVGDNADTDDDGDGVEDSLDVFPLDPARSALRSFRFDAETEDSRLGSSLAVIGDIDGDGTPEVALGAPNAETGGAAYVLSTPELGVADNADGAEDGAVSASGIAARAGSWELRGGEGNSAVVSVFAVGDLTGDGSPEFGVVTGPDGEQSVYVVSGTDLAEADAEDGTSDGVLDLSALPGNGRASRHVSGLRRAAGDGLAAIGDADDDGRADLLVSESMADDEAGLAGLILGDVGARAIYDWTFSGEQAGDTAGRGLGAADFDGDGLPDLVVGAPGREHADSGGGAVYVVGSRDWRAIDAEDGTQDRRIDLGRVAAGAHSWKLQTETPHTQLGARVLVGDVDGDGSPDLLLPAAFSDARPVLRVFVASGDSGRLAALDAQDGAGDGELRLRVGDSSPGRWTFDLDAGVGARIGLDDFDGDGRADLLVGLPPADQANGVCAYLFAAADVFSGAMSGTGSAEPLNGVWPHPNSYALQDCPAWGDAAPVLQAPGDLDGDEAPDLLIGIPEAAEGGAVYLISGADLQALDRLDGHRDRTISLARINRDPPR